MNGSGILRGMLVPLKHFFATYMDDLKWLGKKYYNAEGIARRSTTDVKGIFTVQYPEEKIPVPEEFRFVPFLVYEDGLEGERNIRCTACGICAKVCPPQCIWIVRSSDPETGRPVSNPAEFSIDLDICMNCGLCAEYCPFDAIKMDHDYELANADRFTHNIHNKERLMKPASYYAGIRPINFVLEETIKAEKAAAKAGKPTGNDAPATG
jgi:NADH-quinone oxidoreductase subunit I